ncbi:MAG: protoheme IX farnesyltransferase [Phycisphaerales bacterium]|nr:protoheme IX farnesyltransferase [Phycisphaerales bacterium]
MQTTKPGITKLVTITSMVGLGMAFAQRWNDGQLTGSALGIAVTVVASIIGTALSAGGGANALNQWAERERDALMRRTSRRPIPSGRLTPRQVLVAGLSLSAAGLAILWAWCGLPAMLVSAVCVLVYVLIYTPMKAATWTATLVGAIPGALPPLIGWAAAYQDRGFASLIDPGAASLFALMFVWQLPHFLAIAWMYRDDYALGGCGAPGCGSLGTEDRAGDRGLHAPAAPCNLRAGAGDAGRVGSELPVRDGCVGARFRGAGGSVAAPPPAREREGGLLRVDHPPSGAPWRDGGRRGLPRGVLRSVGLGPLATTP